MKSEDLSLTLSQKTSPPQRGRGGRGGGTDAIPSILLLRAFDGSRMGDLTAADWANL